MIKAQFNLMNGWIVPFLRQIINRNGAASFCLFKIFMVE